MGRRKNGTGGVSHRKDGRWKGRVVIGYDEKGLPKTKNVLAKTKGECLKKLKALKESLTVEEKPQYGKNMTFGEWIDFWFREFCSPRLKDSTKQTYGYRIYQQIIPNIGHIPLTELKTNDLQAFYAHLKTDGRLIRRETNGTSLSDAHIRAIHAHCNAALNKAVEEEPTETADTPSEESPAFVPAEGKYRKRGTGYVKQPSVNCWQGRYTPRVDGKRVSYNVYGATEEECEAKLAEKIREVKAEMGRM